MHPDSKSEAASMEETDKPVTQGRKSSSSSGSAGRRVVYHIVLPLVLAACLTGLLLCRPAELYTRWSTYAAAGTWGDELRDVFGRGRVKHRADTVDLVDPARRYAPSSEIEATILSFAGDASAPPPPPLSHSSRSDDDDDDDEGEDENAEQGKAGRRGKTGAASNNNAGATTSTQRTMHCFTLEAYSDRFLLRERDRRLRRQPQQQQLPHFFGCGTRVVDLRTEDRPDYLRACHTTRNSMSDSNTAFASLRVVLTDKELRWHEEGRLNVARQRIPLAQFNDDYCDCLDGTDELLTNACSMAGVLAPLAGARWPQYLQANKHAPLYEDEAEGSGAEAGERLARRLYRLGGPVLPFRCAHDARTLLAPSAIGDGVADCCDASDEQALQHYPYLMHGPKQEKTNTVNEAEANTEALLRDKYARVLAREHDKAVQRRRARVGQMAARVHAHTRPDPLYPHHSSLAAVLVERGGGGALMSCAAVKQTRLASARTLHEVVRRGHAIQQERAAEGYDKLGRELEQSAPLLLGRLANVSRQVEQMSNALQYAARYNSVPQAVLQREEHRLRQLMQHEQELRLGYQLNELVRTQHVFGPHFEFYPLAAQAMEVRLRDVLSSAGRPRRLIAPANDTITITTSGTHRVDGIHVLSQDELRDLFAQGPEAVMARLHVGHVVLRRLRAHFAQHLVGVYNATQMVRRRNTKKRNITGKEKDTGHESEQEGDGDEVQMEQIPFGMWQPMQTENTTAGFHLLDTAGDVDLPRRLFMRPRTRLTRGLGRTQWPTRQPEAARFISHSLPQPKKHANEQVNAALTGDMSAKSARERVQQAERQSRVRVPHFQATPNVAVVHFFDDGVLCGGSARDGQTRSYGRVLYVCDANDTVLRWGRDGLCGHEVVIGTPSACAPWVMRAAEEELRRAEREAASDKT